MGTRPSALDVGTVKAKYLDDNDDPFIGSVTFVPDLSPKSIRVLGQAWRAVGPKTVTLVNGAFEVQLIATSDPDVTPINWTWTATVSGPNGNASPFPVLTFTLAPNQVLDLNQTSPVGSVSTGTPNVVPAGTGTAGASAYEVAVANGFSGTVQQWLASLVGATGASAYQVAVAQGYQGSAAQWLASLVGAAGKSVELQKTATAIQWRQENGTWADLVLLSAITGADGKSVELQKTGTAIQWRQAGGAWADLVTLAAITGPTGARGARLTTGAGAPGTITGQLDGDSYINTLNSDLYSLSAGTWSKVGNVRGLTGDPGQRGQGVLALAAADQVPAGTPAGTVIVRS